MSGYEGVPVALAGGSGFIGKWVGRKLAERGAQVYLIGRYDLDGLENIYREVRPAVTFNLAGYGIDPAQRDEATAYEVNADLPRKLALTVSGWRHPTWPGQHFVHAGSAVEYGDAGGDLREDGPARPLTLYAKSKWQGTRAVAEAGAQFGFRAVTARLFTVYGPGERAGRLLPSLLEARRTGRQVPLSSGRQRRDFTYVEDVAEGLLQLGLASQPDGGIVNLATGRLTTVRGFVEIAAEILGIPAANLCFGAIPASGHEMEHEAVAVDRLRRIAAWLPPTTVAAGVRKTLEFSLLERAGT